MIVKRLVHKIVHVKINKKPEIISTGDINIKTDVDRALNAFPSV